MTTKTTALNQFCSAFGVDESPEELERVTKFIEEGKPVFFGENMHRNIDYEPLEGKFKPIVDSVYEFDNVLGAYDRLMTKRATGKVVVKVDPTVD